MAMGRPGYWRRFRVRGTSIPTLAIVVIALSQTGCSTLGYYWQSVSGHLQLMWDSQPIGTLIDDPNTPSDLKRKLETMRRVREFASRELKLPDNGSYYSYVDVGRKHVVWSVVATEEFSLQPRTWCFPVAGCVSYRGYFSAESARAYGAGLRAMGLDVYIAGVKAYSTLGWFADPIPNTILDQPDYRAAAFLFHELAHQRLYVPDDSAFNEAFAVAVEQEGMQRWLRAEGAPELFDAYARAEAHQRAFLELVLGAREKLVELYGLQLDQGEKRRRKAAVFQELRQSYATSKQGWPDYDGAYDRWFATELNNAKLALVATYHGLVPAFQRLLAAHDYDLPAFYRACEQLGRLAASERQRALR